MYKDQKQQVSDGSTAIQAAGNIVITNTGLSFSEVREVALDVFRSNFYELSGIAKGIAKSRAEEVTEKFLNKLLQENPNGLAKANDPDFQYAIFTVQKEFARTGDKDLGDLLVDLLVDRSKQENRNILQIVLNESLNTAPKLTDDQIASLALVFLFKYTKNYGIGNHLMFGQYLDKHAAPFIAKQLKNMSGYQHLEFCGCGSISMRTVSLEAALGSTYQGQFLKGFKESEITEQGISIGRDQNFFITCLNDPTHLQINANDKKQLEENFQRFNIPLEDRQKILALFDLNKMSESEIKEKCIEIRPYMGDLFEAWSNSAMAQFTLTSVGIAIGHANIKRFVGEFSDLSIWIN